MQSEIRIDADGFDGNIKMLEDAVIRLQKDLNFLLQKLDSSNIVSINTSKTPIKNKDETLVISGDTIRCKNDFELGYTNGSFVLYASPSGSGSFKSADNKTIYYSDGIITRVT